MISGSDWNHERAHALKENYDAAAHELDDTKTKLEAKIEDAKVTVYNAEVALDTEVEALARAAREAKECGPPKLAHTEATEFGLRQAELDRIVLKDAIHFREQTKDKLALYTGLDEAQAHYDQLDLEEHQVATITGKARLEIDKRAAAIVDSRKRLEERSEGAAAISRAKELLPVVPETEVLSLEGKLTAKANVEASKKAVAEAESDEARAEVDRATSIKDEWESEESAKFVERAKAAVDFKPTSEAEREVDTSKVIINEWAVQEAKRELNVAKEALAAFVAQGTAAAVETAKEALAAAQAKKTAMQNSAQKNLQKELDAAESAAKVAGSALETAEAALADETTRREAADKALLMAELVTKLKSAESAVLLKRQKNYGQVQEYMRQHKLTLPEKKNDRWLRKQFTELYNGVDSSSLDNDHINFEEQFLGPDDLRTLYAMLAPMEDAGTNST